MKVIDLLDYTIVELAEIRQSGESLYSGSVENVPYKYIRREVIGFGLGVTDGYLSSIIISI